MNELQKIEAAEAASHATPGGTMPCPALPRPTSPRQALPGHASYHKKLQRLLAQMGGTHLLDDILSAIHDGKMQSFCLNNSWIITQVAPFPRVKALEVFAAVGDLDDLRILHDRILDFAAEIGAGVIRAYGRKGWLPDAARRGWRVKAKYYVYQKEM